MAAMADADALLRQGDVDGARAALIEAVRAHPGDQQTRMFLFQLFAVNGEWDKARNQLQALTQLSPEAQMLAVTYNQAIDAEKQRAAIFAGSAEIEILAGAGGWADGIAAAIGLFARGNEEAAVAARDAAFDAAPEMPGHCNGQAFDWISDCDARFGPTFEAIIGGRYGLIPFDAVKSVTSEGPTDLRDMIWYPVEIDFRSGYSGAAFLPARYPGSEAASDGPERLGRITAWTDKGWGDQGSGQRLLSLSDGDDVAILDIRKLEFA
jgi:type VI secretion system protein ImpE